MTQFGWAARVYWEDTDAGGVVYYANYLRYLERARTEWLRGHGFSQHALATEQQLLFTVVALNIEYRKPAKLDDALLVTCEPRAGGAASVFFDQCVYRTGPLDERDLLASAQVRVACIDARTLRPQRLPDFLVDALCAQEQA